MQLPAILENLIIAISTAGVTWFFSRRKQSAEIKTNELDNVEKAITIWRQQAEDVLKRFDELSKKYDALSSEVEALRRENRGLKAELKKVVEKYNHQ